MDGFLGTLIVGLILAGILFLAARQVYRKHKNKQNGCCGCEGCSSCPGHITEPENGK